MSIGAPPNASSASILAEVHAISAVAHARLEHAKQQRLAALEAKKQKTVDGCARIEHAMPELEAQIIEKMRTHVERVQIFKEEYEREVAANEAAKALASEGTNSGKLVAVKCTMSPTVLYYKKEDYETRAYLHSGCESIMVHRAPYPRLRDVAVQVRDQVNDPNWHFESPREAYFRTIQLLTGTPSDMKIMRMIFLDPEMESVLVQKMRHEIPGYEAACNFATSALRPVPLEAFMQ